MLYFKDIIMRGCGLRSVRGYARSPLSFSEYIHCVSMVKKPGEKEIPFCTLFVNTL
jgi:hypothetical protein